MKLNVKQIKSKFKKEKTFIHLALIIDAMNYIVLVYII